MIQCPTCGSNVADDADLCPDCGMDLQGAAPTSPPPAAPAPAASIPAVPSAVPQPPAFEFDGVDLGKDSDLPTPSVPPAASADSTARTVVMDAAPAASFEDAPPPPAPGATATLTLKRAGALTSEKFLLGAMSSVGRFDPDSGPVDVDMAPLPEASYVSRHHAQIRRDDSGQWLIKDLGSRNGTFVKGAGGSFARVAAEHPLSDGDEVSLGNARFEFRLGA